jgi:hypothetical protein
MTSQKCIHNQRAHTQQQYIECLKSCYSVVYDIYYKNGGFSQIGYVETDQVIILVEDKLEPYGVSLYSYALWGLCYYSFNSRIIQTSQICPLMDGPGAKHDIEKDYDLMENMQTEIAKNILATIKDNIEIQKYIDEQDKIDSFEPIGYTEEDRINSRLKNKEYYF